ncbi:hypothetical protein GCM10011409_36320 [Lentibacillus populi]|uniref:Uncharacterized protein n=1 Tax=Lentibacillus populi TaxID=1827502 RepID=A0A9W5U101_9BACI|nr:hypothetical protein GCM10011409_36320 [Lentibacillus populi]
MAYPVIKLSTAAKFYNFLDENKSESARFGRTTKTGTLYRQAWYLGVDLDLQDLIRRLFEHVI